MGRKRKQTTWIYILKDAVLSYRDSDIKSFIKMWNEGEPVAAIAEKLNVKKTDVALLVMHCEIENLIEPRPGGLLGSKDFKWNNIRNGVER